MRSPIAIALIAAALAGCATVSPYATLEWDAFIGTFAGVPHRDSGYMSGTAKVAGFAEVASAIAAGNSRFVQWCEAHGGKGDPVQVLARASPAVSAFQEALAQKINAERVQGLEWVPTVAVVCVDAQRGQEVVAALVSDPGRKSEARESQGKVIDKLTRVFFDRQQAIEFVSLQAKREVDRITRSSIALRDREAKRLEATSRLRLTPKVGDRTSVGVLIELRPPLGLIQYDARYRAISNRPPSEWLPIDTLTAPSED